MERWRCGLVPSRENGQVNMRVVMVEGEEEEGGGSSAEGGMSRAS